ncbi:MAG: tRNA (guanosine(46)-N7)-methyltransferase TrmB [Planctomycetota bacterium]
MSSPPNFGPGRPTDAKPEPKFDAAPGVISISRDELPPLPDSILSAPASGHLDPRLWFKEPSLPLEIEIGCGKGTFILEESKARPGTNFLGIEWEGEYLAYTADRLRRAQVTNARMLHADAVEFLQWRVPPGVAQVIHLYFSDPWPKAKHHKNRVVREQFLTQAHRVLVPGGELRIVTDHDDYWTWMEEHFARWTTAPGYTSPSGPLHFERLAYKPPAAAAEGELAGTNFERKYRLEGRPFHSVTLRRPFL